MMKKFSGRICLVGNGDLTKDVFELVHGGEPVIAVDGGVNFLQVIGVQPEFVIGDMDSAGEFDGEVVKIEEQDSTDLEKCLLNVEAGQYLALGFLGSRFDHNFEVLHILAKYLDKDVLFFSQKDVIFRLPKEFEVKLPIGTRISIYPLKETVFESSCGLKYPLDGLTMKQGELIGTSNENSEESVRIVQRELGAIAILPIEFFKLII